jgi:hypothetical protein
VKWYVPNATTLIPFIGYLRHITDHHFNEIHNALGAVLALKNGDNANTDNNNNNNNNAVAAIAFKKSEDIIMNNLATLKGVIRGAAEIICDNNEISAKEFVKMNLNTGREEYLAAVLASSPSPVLEEDVNYVKNFRGYFLKHLIMIHEKLEATVTIPGKLCIFSC